MPRISIVPTASLHEQRPSDPRPPLTLRRAIAPVPRPDGGRDWLHFSDPVDTIVAWELDEVRSALARVEEAAQCGLWAVGMVGYDAGPAFANGARLNLYARFLGVTNAVVSDEITAIAVVPESGYPPAGGASDSVLYVVVSD